MLEGQYRREQRAGSRFRLPWNERLRHYFTVRWGAMILTLMVNVLGGAIFGWTAVGVNSGVGTLWKCWYDLASGSSGDEWSMSILQSIINVGAGAGALSGGLICDKLGRKKAIMISGAFSLLAFGSAFAANYWAQAFLRLLTGFGVGLASSACNTYVSEMAPKERRGTLGAAFQVSLTFVILLANITAYFVLGEHRDEGAGQYCGRKPDILGRSIAMFIPGGVFAALLTVVAFIVPESTAWAANGSETQKLEGGVNDDTEQGEASMLAYKRPLYIGLTMCAALQLTGINAVMFYSTKFIAAAGVKQVMLGSVLVMAWNFVTTIASPFAADKLGRRKILLPSLFALSLAILLMDPIYSSTTGTTQNVLGFILLGIYILGFEMGPGCLFWVICNEIYPPAASKQAFSAFNALQWTFTVIVTLTFGPLQKAMDHSVFLLFGIPGLLVTSYLVVALPETKGLSSGAMLRWASGEGSSVAFKNSIVNGGAGTGGDGPGDTL